MLTKLIFFTVLLPFSWAFYDTVPLIAWSSHESTLFKTLNEQTNNVQIERLFRSEDESLCSFDGVVVFEQPGLHATDLKTLPPSSSLPSRLRSARNSAQIPYARRHLSDEESSVSDVVEEFARSCGARMQWNINEDASEMSEAKEMEKSVFYITLPEVYGEGSWRRYRMTELEDSLARTLAQIESTFPKHLIIYTGSLSSGATSLLSRRQSSSSDTPTPFAFAPSNSTTEGGILARYQLLTPGLILSLGLAFFVLFPAVLMGIQALASIQSPVRLDAPKGVTQGKKNQ